MTSSTVELAVAAFALRKGFIEVVQAAMLGAILNNLLLVNYFFRLSFRYYGLLSVQTNLPTALFLFAIVFISDVCRC